MSSKDVKKACGSRGSALKQTSSIKLHKLGCNMNHDPRISPNRYRPPIRCLAQCTAALEPRPDAPTDAVGTHSCVGRTSDSIASAEPASPLAGKSGPARLGCQDFAPLPHPASGFPP